MNELAMELKFLRSHANWIETYLKLRADMDAKGQRVGLEPVSVEALETGKQLLRSVCDFEERLAK